MKSHIGVEGNEKADEMAGEVGDFSSNEKNYMTGGGIRR